MKDSIHSHNFIENDPNINKNERKTLFVVLLTAITMVIEIVAGYLTGSMALLADGWHMASHATALGIAVVTYRLAKSQNLQNKFSFGAGKFIPLGGYSSSIILALMALLMAYESMNRLIHPEAIYFDEAIVVAVVGLIVNLVSVVILKDDHHNDDHHHKNHDHHHDHNLKAAYLHVVADALTSILAILALILGKYYKNPWMDSVVGILGSIVILKWAYGLCKETAWELLDGDAKAFNKEKIIENLKQKNCKVHDLHIWRIAPSAYACELVVASTFNYGTLFYKKILKNEYGLTHVIVEEIIL